VGDSLFHFTPDIKQFAKEKIVVGELGLFASPQAAIRFAITSARGKQMKNPGLVEIHVTPAELKKMKLTKLLRKG